MTKAAELSTRIISFRERLQLSQEQLAVNAGISLSLLQAIEAGQSWPAVGVLVKLSRALGQRLGTFLDDHVRPDPLIVRAGEAKAGASPHTGEAAAPYRYYSLGRGKADRHMEPLLVELEPGKEAKLSSHEGEEFLIILSGEVELSYGLEKSILKPGDTAYYNSVVPHLVAASGEKPASLYAVIFQPL